MVINKVCASVRVASQIRPSNILDNEKWGRAAEVELVGGVEVETLKTLEIREEEASLRPIL